MTSLTSRYRRYRLEYIERALLPIYDRVLPDLFPADTRERIATLPYLYNGVEGMEASATLRRDVQEMLLPTFLARQPGAPYPDGRSAFTPDGVGAASPLGRLLNERIAQATALAIWLFNTDLVDFLADDDIIAYLSRIPPEPNAVTDPPTHIWADPRGYRLADRAWHMTGRMLDDLDRQILLGTLDDEWQDNLSDDLRLSLTPGVALVGPAQHHTLSYEVARLVQSETVHAFAIAMLLAAQDMSEAVPGLVEGMDYALSPRHPKYDICDDIASIGMSGERLRPPYTVGDCPVPVSSTHPNCICFTMPVFSADGKEWLADHGKLGAETKTINPIATRAFLNKHYGKFANPIILGYNRLQ